MARYKKILLVDDHAIVREGAALHLRLIDPEVEILHARTPDDGRKQVEAHRPDLIFLDLRFDEEAEGGLCLLEWLKESAEYDGIPVIVMSGETMDRKAVEGLLEKGAAGFLAKGTADGVEIFRLAMASMEAGAVFIHGARPRSAGTQAPTAVAPNHARALVLKPSLQRVLVRHVKGMPYKRIARELKITEATVKEYVSEMCRIFKVENSKALIYEIARAGVTLEEPRPESSASSGDGSGV